MEAFAADVQWASTSSPIKKYRYYAMTKFFVPAWKNISQREKKRVNYSTWNHVLSISLDMKNTP